MAHKKSQTDRHEGNNPRRIYLIDLYLLLFFLLLSERIRTLCLIPILGPASRSKFIEISCFAGSIAFAVLLKPVLLRVEKSQRDWFLSSLISVTACAQPFLLDGVVRYSNKLGPVKGCIASFLVSNFVPFVAVFLYIQSRLGERIGNAHFSEAYRNIDKSWAHGISLLLCLLLSCVKESLIQNILFAFNVGRKTLLTLVSCAVSMCVSKHSYIKHFSLLLALASAAFDYFGPIAYLNTKLQTEGYAIVDRQESVTGYISVVDNSKDGFRVLRCDHSLLGGVWMRQPASSILQEPIYAIFVTLEAVRLAETERTKALVSKPAEQQQALFIGLGVGTSPAAFIMHGIATTIVEIDPVVHRFAKAYFGLPSNHTALIQDATRFVSERRDSQAEQYDYIVHDVFTGGAEPLELFTIDFLRGLYALLSAEGTIAINYAGDLLRPSAASVVMTTLEVFPRCRLFRETAPSSEVTGDDMTNMVIFCRKTREDFMFREPSEADMLGSYARKQYLMPHFEVPEQQFDGRGGKVIHRDTIKELKESQWENALRHWHYMRDVIPAKVWETY